MEYDFMLKNTNASREYCSIDLCKLPIDFRVRQGCVVIEKWYGIIIDKWYGFVGATSVPFLVSMSRLHVSDFSE